MKTKSLKSLKLNKKSISFLNIKGGVGGDTSNTGNHLTADIRDCPDNTLAVGCGSIGACPDSYWCPVHEDSIGTTNMMDQCVCGI